MPTIVRSQLQPGPTVVVPQEVFAALGSPTEVFLLVDAQSQTVVLSARHPSILHNEAVLDQLAWLNEDISLEEYGAPVPEDFLERRRKEPGDTEK